MAFTPLRVELDRLVFGPAIYVLYRQGIEVYVGQSISAIRRLCDHHREEAKAFDHVAVFPVERSSLDATESAFIRYFRPKYNKRTPNVGSPVMDAELLLQAGILTPEEAIEYGKRIMNTHKPKEQPQTVKLPRCTAMNSATHWLNPGGQCKRSGPNGLCASHAKGNRCEALSMGIRCGRMKIWSPNFCETHQAPIMRDPEDE